MVMKKKTNQGDIIKIDNIKIPVLVVSKNYFNNSGEIIGCPIITDGEAGPLHIFVSGDKTKGYVHCEKMKLFDLKERGYSITDRIHMDSIIDITDAIQGIFDYI